jgi:putative ABC transport system permease protein
VGAVNLSSAWRSDGDTDVLPIVGLGAALVVIGFLVVGPVLSGPSVRGIGFPLPRLLGVRGRLATENAARSPRRTSATASAVVIGVALVVFITVFAASASTSVTTEVNRSFNGDLAVSAKSMGGLSFAGGMPLSVADEVRGVDGIDEVSALGFGGVDLEYPDSERASHFVTTIEPDTIDAVLSPRMVEGEVGDLTDDGIILDTHIVDDHDIELGDIITITAPGGGTLSLELQGVSDDFNVLGYLTVTRDALAPIYPGLVDVQVVATIDPGEDLPEMMERVADATSEVPNLEVLDREGLIGSIAGEIKSYLTLVYGLLLLSIVTAFLGIANTLSLSITERIRELGLLRAVGMDRAGVRAIVRWEAAVIAALGAGVGLIMGIVLSFSLMQALQGLGLASTAFPAGWMAVIVLATGVLGTLAAVRPSRRAAALSILDAIAHE